MGTGSSKDQGEWSYLEEERKSKLSSLINSANANLNLRRYEEAIINCNEAISLDNTNADAYNCRGYARFRLGKHEKASNDYSKARKTSELDSSYAAYTSRRSAIDYIKNNKKPLPEDFSFGPESYALIRFWPPHIGDKQVSYAHALVAQAAGSPAGMGHLSIAIRHGAEEIYVSHWPTETTLKGRVPAVDNRTLEADIDAEGYPDKYIPIYGLDTKKMIDNYGMICQALWTLFDKEAKHVHSDKNKQPKLEAYNCASAVYELLKVGGLFDYYLDDKEKIKGRITPINVAELSKKAKKIEKILYPETVDLLIRTIEYEYTQAAAIGASEVLDISEKKPDYIDLFERLASENFNTFFKNIVVTANKQDEKSRAKLQGDAKAAAKLGTYKWEEFILKNPAFDDKLTKVFKDKGDELKQQLNEIRTNADKEQKLIKARDLLTLIGGLKDININDNEKQKKECHKYNEGYHNVIKESIKNPYTKLSERDDNGLNALHKAILKDDLYSVTEIIKKFPGAINKVVKSRDQMRINPNKSEVSSMGLFYQTNVPQENVPQENRYAGSSPLDLAKFINDIKLIDLLTQHGAECFTAVTSSQPQSSPSSKPV